MQSNLSRDINKFKQIIINNLPLTVFTVLMYLSALIENLTY